MVLSESGTCALDGVSFDLKPGEAVAVVGEAVVGRAHWLRPSWAWSRLLPAKCALTAATLVNPHESCCAGTGQEWGMSNKTRTVLCRRS